MLKTIASKIMILSATLALVGMGCTQEPASPISTMPPIVPEKVPSTTTPISANANVKSKSTTTIIRPAKVNRVSIDNFAFKPIIISIKAGDTVIWRQLDKAPHSVVFSDGTASSILQQGQEYARTFTNPGDFKYHCGIHPSMTGTVSVK